MIREALEDTVEYWIYPFGATTLADVIAYILKLSDGYIWHNDLFRLVQKDFPVRHYFGYTNFGDNNNDEWFVVHLILKLSVEFPDIVVRLQDHDGDFLLIEASDFLPRWMNSSSVDMRNRVYIHNGAIHVIPRRKKKEQNDNTDPIPSTIESAHQGASLVFNHPEITVADSSLHLCIEKKVGDLVDNLDEDFFHYANCYLPCNLAFVLSQRPKFISKAVQAFYLRMPEDLKYCRESKYIPHTKVVRRRVKFTRHLYAMLSQQKYSPDRRSTWPLPSSTNPAFKEHMLGLKLTCGFEILCRRSENDSKSNDDLADWEKFVNRLKASDYFQGEVDGSAKYVQLLGQARAFFEENSNSDSNSVGSITTRLLNECPIDFYDGAKIEEDHLLPPDDDSWLNVSPEKLDKLFLKAETAGSQLFNNSAEKSSRVKKDIKARVKDFINAETSFKGANIGDGAKREESKKPVNAMIDLNLPESSSDSSDMDSYGSGDSSDDDIPTDELKQMQMWGNVMRDYMRHMDAELGETDVGKTFASKSHRIPGSTKLPSTSKEGRPKSSGADSIDLEDDNFSTVDVDKNLVSNMLSAYKSESGLPGPASTLLHGLNILPSHVHRALDSDDDGDFDSDINLK